jgi:hypothetical protein
VPKFTYTGDEPRYYAPLGLSVDPGDVVDIDAAPDDGRFTAVSTSTSKSSTSSSASTTSGSADAASTVAA